MIIISGLPLGRPLTTESPHLRDVLVEEGRKVSDIGAHQFPWLTYWYRGFCFPGAMTFLVDGLEVR